MSKLMHRVFPLFALLALVATSSRAAQAEEFTIDPAHNAFYFNIGHLNDTSRVFGRFNDVKGTVTVGDETAFDITIAAESVDTGIEKRDDHLRSPDFFNVKQFPTITFKSTKVEKDGENLKVTGDLTLHGVTRSVTASVKQTGPRDTAAGRRAGFSSRLAIKRSDYGMTNMIGPAGDEVNLFIEFEAVPAEK